MGQKTSPISQRLYLNRWPDSSWYSDYYYSKLLSIDINWRHYLESLSALKASRISEVGPTGNYRKSGRIHSRTTLHYLPKSTLVHLCVLSRPEKLKRSMLHARRVNRSALKRPPRMRNPWPINMTSGCNALFAGNSKQYKHKKHSHPSFAERTNSNPLIKQQVSPLDLFVMQYLRDMSHRVETLLPVHKIQMLFHTLQHKNVFASVKSHTKENVSLQLSNQSTTSLQQHKHELLFLRGAPVKTLGKKPIQQALNPPLTGATVKPCFHHIQSVLEKHLSVDCSNTAIKFSNLFMSAGFVAKEIALRLQHRGAFGSICRQLFLKAKQHNYVEGIRVSCSGRLRGAEIARTELKKFGQTSLHVFRNHIDYAKLRVNTKYGVLGLKVWISYKKTN